MKINNEMAVINVNLNQATSWRNNGGNNETAVAK
jgi:hypothetical protein